MFHALLASFTSLRHAMSPEHACASEAAMIPKLQETIPPGTSKLQHPSCNHLSFRTFSKNQVPTILQFLRNVHLDDAHQDWDDLSDPTSSMVHAHLIVHFRSTLHFNSTVEEHDYHGSHLPYSMYELAVSTSYRGGQFIRSIPQRQLLVDYKESSLRWPYKTGGLC